MHRRRVRGVRRLGDSGQLQIDWSISHEDELPTVNAASLLTDKPPTPTSHVAPQDDIKPTTPFTAKVGRRRNPLVARLPAPRPVPAAIAAGRFGHDENNRPIRPARDEIRAIMECQADKLVGMLDAMAAGVADSDSVERLQKAFDSLIAACAQDFGAHVAERLEVYARRRASSEESEKYPSQGR